MWEILPIKKRSDIKHHYLKSCFSESVVHNEADIFAYQIGAIIMTSFLIRTLESQNFPIDSLVAAQPNKQMYLFVYNAYRDRHVPS